MRAGIRKGCPKEQPPPQAAGAWCEYEDSEARSAHRATATGNAGQTHEKRGLQPMVIARDDSTSRELLVGRPHWLPFPDISNIVRRQEMSASMQQPRRRFILVSIAIGAPYEASLQTLRGHARAAGFDAVQLWTREELERDPIFRANLAILNGMERHAKALRSRHPYRPYCAIYKPIALWRAMLEAADNDYIMWADSSRHHVNQTFGGESVRTAATTLLRGRKRSHKLPRPSRRWAQTPWYRGHEQNGWQPLGVKSALGLMECSPIDCDGDLFRWNARSRSVNMVTATAYSDLISGSISAFMRRPHRLNTNLLLRNDERTRLFVWDWLGMALAKPSAFCSSYTQDQAAFTILADNRSFPLINHCVYLKVRGEFDACGRHSQRIDTFLGPVLSRGAFEIVDSAEIRSEKLAEGYDPLKAEARSLPGRRLGMQSRRPVARKATKGNACPDRSKLQTAIRASIPRIIHQAWIVPDPRDAQPPGVLRVQAHRWSTLLPSWSRKLWNASAARDLWRAFAPELLPVYDGYRAWVERADATRLLIMHVHGGIWADLDVVPCAGLEASLGHPPPPLLLVRDPWRGTKERKNSQHISNFFMASVPGHPFWVFALSLLPSRQYHKLGTMFRTGPRATLASNSSPNLRIC